LIKDVDCAASFSPDGHEFVFTRGTPSRNVTEVLIANADGTGEHVLVAIPDGDPSYNPGATWSPDGRTIAVSVYVYGKKLRFILYLVSVKDGAIRELYSSAFPIGRAVWLPEGDNLVVPLWDPSALRGQLWTISYPQGELQRLTNDLADYDVRIDLTRDGRILSAIHTDRVSNVWMASATDLSGAQQVTFSDVPFYQVFEAADGKLIAQTMDGKLWIMNAKGSQRTPFVEARAVGLFTPCGHFVLFLSRETGSDVLTRVEADGSNATVLLRGDVSDVICSPEGKFLFYINFAHPQKIWRMPVEGGPAVEIGGIRGESVVGGMSISPDGKRIAYIYALTNPLSLKLAVVSLDETSTTELWTVPGGASGVRWSPDGRGLQFELTRDGSSNLWEQPLAGGEPRQVTKFTSGRIFDYNWSPDYKRLILTRGSVNSDVVLLSNFR
jgi:Tol biopolymer transport system component